MPGNALSAWIPMPVYSNSMRAHASACARLSEILLFFFSGVRTELENDAYFYRIKEAMDQLQYYHLLIRIN